MPQVMPVVHFAIKSHFYLDLFIKESLISNTDYSQVRIAEIMNQTIQFNGHRNPICMELKLRLSQLIRITCLHNWL